MQQDHALDPRSEIDNLEADPAVEEAARNARLAVRVNIGKSLGLDVGDPNELQDDDAGGTKPGRKVMYRDGLGLRRYDLFYVDKKCKNCWGRGFVTRTLRMAHAYHREHKIPDPKPELDHAQVFCGCYQTRYNKLHDKFAALLIHFNLATLVDGPVRGQVDIRLL